MSRGGRITLEQYYCMLVTVLVKDKNWRLYLGMNLAKWCVLTGKWQFRLTETPTIYSPFGGSLGLLQVRECKVYCT